MLHANLLGVKVWQPAILINTCGAVVNFVATETAAIPASSLQIGNIPV